MPPRKKPQPDKAGRNRQRRDSSSVRRYLALSRKEREAEDRRVDAILSLEGIAAAETLKVVNYDGLTRAQRARMIREIHVKTLEAQKAILDGKA